MSPREIEIIENIMGANQALAAENRRLLDRRGVRMVNVMASPGAGKTTLIINTARKLEGRRRVAVIEGDVASTVDAERIRDAGLPVVQINTGGQCHLDATQVEKALERLPLDELDLIFVENVGNLICPVGFDLGEHTKLALSSVPEGDDKPHKYPSIFAHADVLVLGKTDLLPHMDFDTSEFDRLVRSLNPDIEIFQVSCVDGAGLEEWAEWLITESEKS